MRRLRVEDRCRERRGDRRREKGNQLVIPAANPSTLQFTSRDKIKGEECMEEEKGGSWWRWG